MGAALSIWCTGSAILIAGESAAIAAVGTRLASVGYPMLFGALLHYVMLLVHRGRLPGRRWAIALLYLPGLISVTGLAVLPAAGHFTETLIKTPAG